MTKRNGYALLAALAAVVVLISVAIFVGVGGDRSVGDPSAATRQQRNSAAPAVSGRWVGSWATAPAAAQPKSFHGHAGKSIRNVVHTSIGGSAARIQLSNLYGTRPLSITGATIALAAAPSNPTAASGSMRRLTFSGRPSVSIPAGQAVVSDPVRLNVPAAADLLVSTYSPTPSGPVTYHPYARQTSYLAEGNRTGDPRGTAYTEQSPYWRYLTGVDVYSTEAEGTLVALGDSITDGITSTAGANHRWPDFLAERLREESGAPRYGVLNQGISGNRVLIDGSRFSPNNGPSGLSRFERDVMTRSGVRVAVVQLGINDILKTPRQLDARQILDGLRQMVRQAHGRGVPVVGGTLLPFGGHRGYGPQTEAVRQQVNQVIRAGGVFDAVADFDRALRDPSQPHRLLPAYDSGDHLHPSDDGYREMARTIKLSDLRGTAPARL
ncbi:MULTISPECIES: SGNH/GDSL hydrolase family protein [Streptomyces]|uniref:SGNH hydrolase n=1 Tax=Streptomyces fradiae TaxID=1906 RepID=A0ACC4WC53_STRFR|nr:MULTISPECIES: SGNH/GDSL hydrolase family protein [Streptomyces]KNE82151.1 SGNH hydrolase [Streptomyces fradiae]OFA39736.1 SGNH hydrolase [Streptomyces fradiae]